MFSLGIVDIALNYDKKINIYSIEIYNITLTIL